eukprot:scaffold263_cov159-Amphora_coffeaeformis.AAC.3
MSQYGPGNAPETLLNKKCNRVKKDMERAMISAFPSTKTATTRPICRLDPNVKQEKRHWSRKVVMGTPSSR